VAAHRTPGQRFADNSDIVVRILKDNADVIGPVADQQRNALLLLRQCGGWQKQLSNSDETRANVGSVSR